MQIRDADLRDVVVEAGIRPGDALWRLLSELQRRRDRDRADTLPRPSAPRVEREGAP